MARNESPLDDAPAAPFVATVARCHPDEIARELRLGAAVAPLVRVAMSAPEALALARRIELGRNVDEALHDVAVRVDVARDMLVRADLERRLADDLLTDAVRIAGQARRLAVAGGLALAVALCVPRLLGVW